MSLWTPRSVRRWAWGLAAILLVALVGLPAWADAEQSVIAADQVVNQDVYLKGDTVVIDGTVNGNAVLVGETVILNGTVTDDVYLAGDTITLAGTVGGDAIAAGRQIFMRGTVEADLIAAGRAIVIEGRVGDDVRMAGQILQLNQNAQIGDDVVAAGASLLTTADSQVGSNLTLAVGQADLAGTVGGNLIGGLGSVRVSGSVEGQVNAVVGAVKPAVVWPGSDLDPVDVPVGLTLTDTARIGGNLTYRSSQMADIPSGAEIGGEVVYAELAPSPRGGFSTAWVFQQVQRFLALLVVGAVLLRWQPSWLQSLGRQQQIQPWPSLGWGALAVLAVAVASVAIAGVTLLLTVLLGFTLSDLALPVLSLGMVANLVLAVSFGVFAAFVPQVVLSAWGGSWLLQRISGGAVQRYGGLLLGLLLYVLATAIPIVGGLINLGVILLGLGALWLWVRSQRSPAPLTAPQ